MSTISHDPEALLVDIAWMRRLAARLVDDPAAAEDLVQDTWLAALKRRWPMGRPSRAWLSTVIRNLAVTRHRGDRRRRSREERIARPALVPEQEELVSRLEAQHALVAAVLELEEPTRSILLMRYQEELTPTEIARRLELAPGTVRSRISRALQHLRGRLTQRFGDDLRAALAQVTGVGLGDMGGGVTQPPLLGGVTLKKILLVSAADGIARPSASMPDA